MASINRGKKKSIEAYTHIMVSMIWHYPSCYEVTNHVEETSEEGLNPIDIM
jgi:hypothetical protein